MITIDPKINSLIENGRKAYNVGEYISAHNHFNDACSLSERIYGKNHPCYAITLNYYGLFLYNWKRDRNSIHYCESSKEIFEETGQTESIEYRTILNNLGVIYSGLGFKQKAYLIYSDILKKESSKKDSNYASVLINRGSLLREMRRYHEALPDFKEANKIYMDNGKERTPDYAMLLNFMGLNFIGLRKYDKSLLCFNQAIDILEENGMEKGPYYMAMLNNIALAYQEKGNYKEAALIYIDLLERFKLEFGEDNYNITNIYDNLSKIYIESNNYEKAFEFIYKSSTVTEKYLDEFSGFLSDNELLEPINKFQLHLHLLFSLLQQWKKPPQKCINSAFNLIFRRKAFFMDSRIYQRRLAHLRNDKNVEDDLILLKSKKSEIALMMNTQPENIKNPEEFRMKLFLLEKECRTLERSLACRSPDSYLENIINIEGIKEIQAQLPPNSVVIEFIKYNIINFKKKKPHKLKPRYSAFILAYDSEPQLVDLGFAIEINNLIKKAIHDIEEEGLCITYNCELPKSLNSSMTIDKLSKKVISPIYSAIASKERLFIIPDDQLNLFPLGILKNDDDYLIENKQIIYLTSSRDLLKDKESEIQEQTEPIIIADPDFNLTFFKEDDSGQIPMKDDKRAFSEPLELFGELEGTNEEGKKVHRIIGGQLWLGAEALKSKLKDVHSPKILHIASHGHYQPRNKNNISHSYFRCAVPLAGANSFIKGISLPPEAEDGILTAYEVTELDLKLTDLAVLSACETGLGDFIDGEGVFGFRRSFALAGAKALVMSLWPIPDGETVELMNSFYSNLTSGKEGDVALQEAQLLIKNKNSHPYFWGAFVFQGVPKRIY